MMSWWTVYLCFIIRLDTAENQNAIHSWRIFIILINYVVGWYVTILDYNLIAISVKHKLHSCIQHAFVCMLLTVCTVNSLFAEMIVCSINFDVDTQWYIAS